MQYIERQKFRTEDLKGTKIDTSQSNIEHLHVNYYNIILYCCESNVL